MHASPPRYWRTMLLSCLLISAASCGDDAAPGPRTGSCDDPPALCATHCISDTPVASFEDCCDSVTCYCDPDTGQWDTHYCDPPLTDASPDARLDAGPDADPDAAS